MKRRLLSASIRKRLLKGAALVVSSIMVVTSSFPAVTVSAAVSDLPAEKSLLAPSVKSVSSLPVGTVIYSDSIPGFNILFNGQKSYEIKASENKIDLDITVMDAKLASENASAIKWIFGVTVTKLTKGAKLNTMVTMSGLPRGKEKVLYQAFEESGIDDEMAALLPGNNRSEINISDSEGLVEAIVEAIKQEEKSEEEKEKANSQKTADTPKDTPVITDEDDDDYDYEPEPEPEPEPSPEPQPEPQPKPEPQPDPKPEPQPEPVVHYDQERVIMLYAAPTNLEPEFGVGTCNLLDILRAGIPDNTRMFIVTGGTTKWYMDELDVYSNYAKVVLYPAKESGYTQEEEEKANELAKSLLQLHSTKLSGMQYWEVVSRDGVFNLSKIKDVNGYMTDNAQLTDFIDYCTGQINAKYYDLILYGHGNGVLGYGGDDLLNKYYADNPGVKRDVPTTLSIADLSEAITSTNLYKDGRKLEFIGLDACKMANYEVAVSFSPFADYFVASEEIVPGRGWNYYDVLNGLNKDSTMSSEQLVTEIVDDFVLKFNRLGGAAIGMEATLSAANLAGIEFLDEALSELYTALAKELKDDKSYFDISNAIGRVSNFGATNGNNASDEFDIKLFCESLLLDDYPDIKEKSSEVLSILDECIVNAQQVHTNKGEDFGGLYLYFPANAFRVVSSKDSKGEDVVFINTNVNYQINSLRQMGISEEYDKLINLFAILEASGYRIGQDWVTLFDENYQDVVVELSGYSEYKDVLNTVKQYPDSEALAKQIIEKQLSDRVTKNDVSVLRGYTNKIDIDENGKRDITVVENPDGAVITVSKGDILLNEDKTADVRVSADLDGTKVLLGRTELYSENVIEGSTDASDHTSAHWNISKYDNKWYTINDQLSSFVVTETESADKYYGYIPIAIWFDKNLVAGGEGMSRDEYVRSSLGTGIGVKTFVLNVVCDNGNLIADSMTAYRNDNFAESFSASELANSYIEILGGFEECVEPSFQAFSLGTIYTEDGFLEIDRRYVEGLTSDYVLSDPYGCNYVLSKANIGEYGLDDFVKEIPAEEADNAFTWEESKENAAEIRAKAKEEVQAEQEAQAQQEAQQEVEVQPESEVEVQPEAQPEAPQEVEVQPEAEVEVQPESGEEVQPVAGEEVQPVAEEEVQPVAQQEPEAQQEGQGAQAQQEGEQAQPDPEAQPQQSAQEPIE